MHIDAANDDSDTGLRTRRHRKASSYQDVLKTELASGTAPDVFWIPGTDVADFATRGLIMDMRGMADATDGYSRCMISILDPMFHLTFNPETANTGEARCGVSRVTFPHLHST